MSHDLDLTMHSAAQPEKLQRHVLCLIASPCACLKIWCQMSGTMIEMQWFDMADRCGTAQPSPAVYLENFAPLELFHDPGHGVVLQATHPKLALPTPTPHEHGTALTPSLQISINQSITFVALGANKGPTDCQI